MVKFDGIKGQELLDVEEKKGEITLIFKDNRFLFVKIQNGELVADSVPEWRGYITASEDSGTFHTLKGRFLELKTAQTQAS